METQTHFSSIFPFKGSRKRILHEKMLQLKAGMQQPLERGPAERRVDGQQTQPEEAGSSSVSHSRKYHSLIQDQARELTHLRQKMRMGRAFSSLLIQHVRNTVRTFEELLSSSRVDRYMEQHFREQLTKGSQLAESLTSKFSTGNCTSEKNQARQMLRTLSLLREMHKKGKVTEVLRTRQEAQPHTLPQIHSSNHGQSATHLSSSSTSLLHEEQEERPSVDVARADLLEKNLVEIQNLRQRLEESICLNDRLQERLEHVLSCADKGKSTTWSAPGVSLATPHSYAQSHSSGSAQDVL
uniref:myomegalin isoform X5 n=1 Tax=Halichoerus grypus TaxID=9711 RepID=UPI001658EDB9|nr:myomegalin isoform X5 [Halichoerus grypus]